MVGLGTPTIRRMSAAFLRWVPTTHFISTIAVAGLDLECPRDPLRAQSSQVRLSKGRSVFPLRNLCLARFWEHWAGLGAFFYDLLYTAHRKLEPGILDRLVRFSIIGLIPHSHVVPPGRLGSERLAADQSMPSQRRAPFACGRCHRLVVSITSKAVLIAGRYATAVSCIPALRDRCIGEANQPARKLWEHVLRTRSLTDQQ